MKIKDDSFRVERKHEIKTALIDFINQPSDKQVRPCPGCRFAVGSENSNTSSEHCSSDCPYAARQMSSDSERYPIEPGIVPLVYAFYTLRLLVPCWSCEGHCGSDGKMTKTPKVWFYSLHDFYAKMVAQYVSNLKGAGLIENYWTVNILPFSQSMFSTTYSLEPNQVSAEKATLASLQKDVRVIAKDLRAEMNKLAQYYIVRADKNQNLQ